MRFGRLIETLLQNARSYIFTTAAPPMLAHALSQSLQVLREDAARRARLTARITQWKALATTLRWRSMPSDTPIQPLVIGSNADTLELSHALWERGIWIPAIRPPTVPAGSARLRITFSAAHEEADVTRLALALREIGA